MVTNPNFARPSEQALDDIRAIVGEKGWRDPSDAPRYFVDPRGRFEGGAALIVTPSSTEEVSRIVAFCNAQCIGIIPYSGGTGVVAGQLSPDSAHAIILSLEKMDRVREVSTDDGVMIFEAGCIL